MTIEFFNKRLIFDPPLLAVQHYQMRRIFIVKCEPKFGRYDILKDFSWSEFSGATPNEVRHRLLGYAHFLGVTAVPEPEEVSLLKELDKIIKEKSECSINLVSIPDTIALAKQKKKSGSSWTSSTSTKSKAKQTKGSS